MVVYLGPKKVILGVINKMAKIFECGSNEDEELIRSFLRMIDKEHVIRDVKLIPVYPYGSEGLMKCAHRINIIAVCRAQVQVAIIIVAVI